MLPMAIAMNESLYSKYYQSFIDFKAAISTCINSIQIPYQIFSLQNLGLLKNLYNVLSILAAKIGMGKLFAKCPNVAFNNNLVNTKHNQVSVPSC